MFTRINICTASAIVILSSFFGCKKNNDFTNWLDYSWYTFYPGAEMSCDNAFIPYLSELYIDRSSDGYSIYEVHPNLISSRVSSWKINETRRKDNKWYFFDEDDSQYIEFADKNNLTVRRLRSGTLDVYLTLNYKKQNSSKSDVKDFFYDNEESYQDESYCKGLIYLNEYIEQEFCKLTFPK